MGTTSYKLGRDAVALLPGVENDDIMDVTINVTADQIEVTTFKSTPLTQWEYMAGLVDIKIDVKCSHCTCVVGDVGPYDIADLPGDLECSVLDVKIKPNMKGVVEYTVSYGLSPTAGS